MSRLVLFAAVATLATFAQAAASDVPATLAPPAGTLPALSLSARGVQLYECQGDAWEFVAPEADLFDASGRRVGSHGAGPQWVAEDGSRVTGRVKARVAAPSAGAVPWLLLDATPSAAPGAFSRVAAIQRVHTQGGITPTTRCTPERAGTVARVPYTADYLFFNLQ